MESEPMGSGGKSMTEREKVCILCGKKEVMLGFICLACQDKIQREATGKRSEMRKEAQKAMIKYGINHGEESE